MRVLRELSECPGPPVTGNEAQDRHPDPGLIHLH
jgi:hypothetical protein